MVTHPGASDAGRCLISEHVIVTVANYGRPQLCCKIQWFIANFIVRAYMIWGVGGITYIMFYKSISRYIHII